MRRWLTRASALGTRSPAPAATARAPVINLLALNLRSPAGATSPWLFYAVCSEATLRHASSSQVGAGSSGVLCPRTQQQLRWQLSSTGPVG